MTQNWIHSSFKSHFLTPFVGFISSSWFTLHLKSLRVLLKFRSGCQICPWSSPFCCFLVSHLFSWLFIFHWRPCISISPWYASISPNLISLRDIFFLGGGDMGECPYQELFIFCVAHIDHQKLPIDSNMILSASIKPGEPTDINKIWTLTPSFKTSWSRYHRSLIDSS